MERIRISSGTTYPIECATNTAQFYLPDIFETLLKDAQVAIITDREVSGYYINDFVKQFDAVGIKPLVIVIDGSQAAKSLEAVKNVFERLTDVEFSKKDLLFALGGGGVIDVAAFVAASYQKGIPYVQIPTSLLAMVDSSISTTAYLNFQSYKNQIGVDATPVHVIIDTNYLRTLPSRFEANGIAQIIQYGLTVQPSLLEQLGNPKLDMATIIAECISLRRRLMLDNPLYLTFGKEIGEAIEGHFRFLKYTHGEAMALGMLALTPSETLNHLYTQFGLPTQVSGVTQETLRKRLMRNHENHAGNVEIVRVDTAGKPRIDCIPVEELPQLFDQLLSRICS